MHFFNRALTTWPFTLASVVDVIVGTLTGVSIAVAVAVAVVSVVRKTQPPCRFRTRSYNRGYFLFFNDNPVNDVGRRSSGSA